MTLTDFNNLLRRYLDGHATPDELRLIDRWYDALNADVAYQFTPDEQARLKARMWQQIEAQTADVPIETKVLPLLPKPEIGLFRVRTWLAAATVALVLLGGWLTYMLRQPTASPTVVQDHFQGELARLSMGLAEYSTTTKPRSVTLPDGSEVYLKPLSAIRFNRKLSGNERVVYLVGDAFFRVTKNARRPFRVVSDQVETQVLGTSFWMKTAEPNNRIDVEVLTGKVQVYERVRVAGAAKPNVPGASEAVKGVVLTPNQKVTVSDKEHWQIGLVAYPQPIAPETASAQVRPVSLRFDNVPFATVCQQLTRLYGIDLDLANADMAACTFTGDLTNQPLYDQLTLLCSTVNARYDVRGTHILISGRGCQP